MQVHMDVKSPNVLLGRNSCAKLADVGLAKFLHKDYLSLAKSVGTFAWSVSTVPTPFVHHSMLGRKLYPHKALKGPNN